ncbi:trypsin 3A1-like [Anopheles ziemanni]|uniref:trypsin 3A1-like n=1 Tax=Anopheles coustani TaxID=139045 RepID=UPI00265B23F3|nr:trypsin 3A1-like [Anopheles coustani]XP_058174120.1 trypsin 3A1-like [Anopheles ziemanni]
MTSGALVSGRITGGSDANYADFPYQLSLRKYNNHICGAAVVKDQLAVTAAHCVADADIDSFTLTGGSSNRSEGVTYYVENIIIHPMFNRNIYSYDIALIRVNESFLENEDMAPIALQSSPISFSTFNPVYCTISGWGQMNNDTQELPEILKAVKIPLVNYTDCRRKWSPYTVTTAMACAGELRRDSCNGDSGGPLVCNNRLYGIVSWGDRYCGSTYPGVYTNISAKDVYNFLDQNIKCQ